MSYRTFSPFHLLTNLYALAPSGFFIIKESNTGPPEMKENDGEVQSQSTQA
jgi:hypothetical protein